MNMFKVKLPKDKPIWKIPMFKDLPKGQTNYCKEHKWTVSVFTRRGRSKICNVCGFQAPNNSKKCSKHQVVHRNGGYQSCPTPTTTEWEIELTRLVSLCWQKGLWHSESDVMENLKSFICTLLQKEHEKWEEELRKVVNSMNKDDNLDCDNQDNAFMNIENFGYNLALSDVLELINKRKIT